MGAWDVALGRDICGDSESALSREWLVTNGLGGYASGSIAGAATRRYHGLLVAATRPPGGRMVLVPKVDEEVVYADGERVTLGTNEYADGTLDPRGYVYLESVALEGSVVRFRYALSGGAVLEKRVWMEHGRNITYVRYDPLVPRALGESRGGPEMMLRLVPYCVCRDHHGEEHGAPDRPYRVEPVAGGVRVLARPGAPACRMAVGPDVDFLPTGVWHWRVLHRAERERGLAAEEDVFQPGVFQAPLRRDGAITLVIRAEDDPQDVRVGPDDPLWVGLGTAAHEEAAAVALGRERARAAGLLARAASHWRLDHEGAGAKVRALDGEDDVAEDVAASVVPSPIDEDGPLDPVIGRLVLAADQFLVARPVPAGTASGAEPDYGADREADHEADHEADRGMDFDGRTVIAGYPWFTDWGRDTMIALPGLTLATGRPEQARALLRTFARHADQGLLPNRFPDDGEAPAASDYNTADATPWYFVALDRYLEATGDMGLLEELFPTLASIVAWHQRGTRFGIGMDPRDGLMRAGAPGVQLTWMDAKVDEWVVTPRRGKPVEVNGLWCNALALMAEWAPRAGAPAESYRALAERAATSFRERFWYADGGYLYDVVDVEGVEGTVDAALRPNQVLAMAPRHSPVTVERARMALAAVERYLLTPLGLRTLASSDPNFAERYVGDQHARDAAYHQGTVWPWLIGPYLDIRCRLATDAAEARAIRQRVLAPFRDHLLAAGIGSISEIAEGSAPFRPVGCVAQAWSVAEVLRSWSEL
jgi:glycogen debranching enzyme